MGNVTNEVILNAILELKGDVGGLVAQVKAQGENLADHIADDVLMNAKIASISNTMAERRGAVRLARIFYVGLSTLSGALAGYFGRGHG